jgi:hypothetical protein
MAMHMRVAAGGALTVALLVGSGQAQDLPTGPEKPLVEDTPVVLPEKPPFVVKTFPVASGDLPRAQFGDGAISLIGDADSKDFGLSFNGTLAPKARVTGKEKLAVYLYIDCDGNKPAAGINVGTVEVTGLKQGQRNSTVFGTADASSFVPLASVKCVSMVLREEEPEKEKEKENEKEKAPYVIKTFTHKDVAVAEDVKVVNATVRLIGDPDSKDFGISYRGTLVPSIDMSGEEKVVVHLYMKCDDKLPSDTAGINVGSVKVADVRKGRDPSLLISTTDASAFVPLKDVECAKLGIN